MKVMSKLNQLLKYKEPETNKCFRFPEDENEDQGSIVNIPIDKNQENNNEKESNNKNSQNKDEKVKDVNKESEENKKDNKSESKNKYENDDKNKSENKDNEKNSQDENDDKDKKNKKQIRELKKPIEVSSFKKKEKYEESDKQSLSELTQVSKDLKQNSDKLEMEFNIPTNQDVVIREFKIKGQKNAFIIYVDGMIDKLSVNNFILRQLMLCDEKNNSKNKNEKENNNENNNENQQSKEDINIDYICNNLIAINQIKKETEFEKIVLQILNGLCALFVEGDTCSVLIETRGYEKRSVTVPQNETVIKGPHEAFIENLRTNLTLIRRIIRNKDLITEILPAGKIDNVSCAIIYLKGVANPKVVEEVKNRINNINIDFIPGGGIMEQLVEDHPLAMIPQILTTERPDRNCISVNARACCYNIGRYTKCKYRSNNFF